MTISDCDNGLETTPYSILNTINMTPTIATTSILSISNEALAQRRQRKKKRGENKKRVSFHEDIFKMMKLDDDEDYPTSYASYKKPELHNNRHSWCAHGDSPYINKRNAYNRNAHSDYLAASTDINFDADVEPALSNGNCPCGLSMPERGVPEGQEDPAKSFRPKIDIELEDNEAQEAYIVETKCGNIVEDCTLDEVDMPPIPTKKYSWSDDISDMESVTTNTNTNSDMDESKAGKGGNNRHLSSPVHRRNMTSVVGGNNTNATTSKLLPLRQAPSKTSLLGRFLRSVTERKFQLNKRHKKQTKPNMLYIRGAKADYESFKDFNDNLEKEIQENTVDGLREISGEKISLKMREIFKHKIYRDKTEQLYKVYKVRSSYMTNGESKPMIALLTDKTLYLTGSKANHSYSNQFVIPYSELDVIMVSTGIFATVH